MGFIPKVEAAYLFGAGFAQGFLPCAVLAVLTDTIAVHHELVGVERDILPRRACDFAEKSALFGYLFCAGGVRLLRRVRFFAVVFGGFADGDIIVLLGSGGCVRLFFLLRDMYGFRLFLVNGGEHKTVIFVGNGFGEVHAVVLHGVRGYHPPRRVPGGMRLGVCIYFARVAGARALLRTDGEPVRELGDIGFFGFLLVERDFRHGTRLYETGSACVRNNVGLRFGELYLISVFPGVLSLNGIYLSRS